MRALRMRCVAAVLLLWQCSGQSGCKSATELSAARRQRNFDFTQHKMTKFYNAYMRGAEELLLFVESVDLKCSVPDACAHMHDHVN